MFGSFCATILDSFLLLSAAMFEKQVFGKSITSGRRLLQEEIDLSFCLCLEFMSSKDLEVFVCLFKFSVLE